MTAAHLLEEFVSDFIRGGWQAVCSCGWETGTEHTTTEALAAWEMHRDTLAASTDDLGGCPTCHRWRLYVGAYDRHGRTIRCRGCLRVPGECWCR